MCGSSRASRIGLRPQSPQGLAYSPNRRGRALHARDAVRRFANMGAMNTSTPTSSVARERETPSFLCARQLDIQQWFDGAVPHGLHYHCRSEWLKPLDDSAIRALADAVGRGTSPMSQVVLRHLGGAIAQVPADATAFRQEIDRRGLLGTHKYSLAKNDFVPR